MQKKLPTIKEIAKELGISVSTVSRALHDHPSIGLRTKMAVRKLAEELNYAPNQAAISFKKGRTFIIGLIVPTLREEFFSAAINGIEKMALENNYIVLTGQSHDDVEREKQLLESMKHHRVDGILASISKSTTSMDHFDRMQQFDIPLVYFDRVPDVPEVHSVRCNLFNGSVEAVEYLIGKGHRRIAYLTGPATLSIKNERLEGYHAALQKHSIAQDPDLIVSTDLSTNSTQEAFDHLMELHDRPTAILAFNDYVAMDAIQHARRKNIRINEDISFVSYANLPITRYVDYPPLASVEQFPYEQGVEATRLLVKLIDNKISGIALPFENIVLQGRLMIR